MVDLIVWLSWFSWDFLVLGGLLLGGVDAVLWVVFWGFVLLRGRWPGCVSEYYMYLMH